MRSVAFAVALSAAGLFAQGPPPGAGPPGGSPFTPPAMATVNVDCAAGQKIGDALKTPADQLTIVFTGTCIEDLLIRRSDVILRGGAPGATIDGAPVTTAWRGVIRSEGAMRLVFADFAIRNSDDNGLVIVYGSATATNLSISDVRLWGIVVGGSNVTLRNTTVSRTLGGILALGGDSFLALEGSTVVTDNSEYGVAAGNGAEVSLPSSSGSVQVTGSRFGVYLEYHASFWTAGSAVTIRGAEYGVHLDTGATADISRADVSGSRSHGISLSRGAVFTGGGVITGNEHGVVADDGSLVSLQGATVTGNAEDDVQVTFGSHLTLYGSNTLGRVTCDASVLARPASACTSTAVIAGQTSTRPPRPPVARLRETERE